MRDCMYLLISQTLIVPLDMPHVMKKLAPISAASQATNISLLLPYSLLIPFSPSRYHNLPRSYPESLPLSRWTSFSPRVAGHYRTSQYAAPLSSMVNSLPVISASTTSPSPSASRLLIPPPPTITSITCRPFGYPPPRTSDPFSPCSQQCDYIIGSSECLQSTLPPSSLQHYHQANSKCYLHNHHFQLL